MTVRVISYGGGVQSSALCVLAVEGVLGDVDAALFANVGDDSENPATLDYVREVMGPWAAGHGLDVVEVARPGGTLLDRLERTDSAAVTIPMRSPGMGPVARDCTADYKRDVVAAWVRAHGATAADPAQIMVGISTDELERAANNRGRRKYEQRTYPLLDLRLNRADCAAVIADAGLPVPPKSACWFCPFHSRRRWREIRRDDPARFDQVAALERRISERQVRLGRPPVFMLGDGPIGATINTAQATLFDDGPDGCESGSCWT